MMGLCATYVDDIIIAGAEEVILGMHQRITAMGPPSWRTCKVP